MDSLEQVQGEYWRTLTGYFGEHSRELAYLREVSALADLWDHLADGDAIDRAAGVQALEAAILKWPLVPWHRYLVPVLQAAHADWQNDPHGPGSREIYVAIPVNLAEWLRHPRRRSMDLESRLRDIMTADLVNDAAGKAGY